MKILITNDDGIDAKGLQALVRVMRHYGELTIVAPKRAQSGMSMAVTMGYKPIAVKHVEQKDGEDWWYLDGTPASCIKFGIDNVLFPERPDLVVSGVNHGSNAATAAIYSGTIGAAMEGAVTGIREGEDRTIRYEKKPDYVLAEFTVFPVYRRKHLAEKAAEMIFERFKGCWEIKYNEKNIAAKTLWNKATEQYFPKVTRLNDTETVLSFCTT